MQSDAQIRQAVIGVITAHYEAAKTGEDPDDLAKVLGSLFSFQAPLEYQLPGLTAEDAAAVSAAIGAALSAVIQVLARKSTVAVGQAIDMFLDLAHETELLYPDSADIRGHLRRAALTAATDDEPDD